MDSARLATHRWWGIYRHFSKGRRLDSVPCISARSSDIAPLGGSRSFEVTDIRRAAAPATTTTTVSSYLICCSNVRMLLLDGWAKGVAMCTAILP